jgi:hypothetical protein
VNFRKKKPKKHKFRVFWNVIYASGVQKGIVAPGFGLFWLFFPLE